MRAVFEKCLSVNYKVIISWFLMKDVTRQEKIQRPPICENRFKISLGRFVTRKEVKIRKLILKLDSNTGANWQKVASLLLPQRKKLVRCAFSDPYPIINLKFFGYRFDLKNLFGGWILTFNWSLWLDLNNETQNLLGFKNTASFFSKRRALSFSYF